VEVETGNHEDPKHEINDLADFIYKSAKLMVFEHQPSGWGKV
jgi:hypothetical protein